MDAVTYQNQRFLDVEKKKPKVPGVRTPVFRPESIFAGRPSESMTDPDYAANAAVGGTTIPLSDSVMDNYNPLRMLLTRKLK